MKNCEREKSVRIFTVLSSGFSKNSTTLYYTLPHSTTLYYHTLPAGFWLVASGVQCSLVGAVPILPLHLRTSCCRACSHNIGVKKHAAQSHARALSNCVTEQKAIYAPKRHLSRIFLCGRLPSCDVRSRCAACRSKAPNVQSKACPCQAGACLLWPGPWSNTHLPCTQLLL